MCFEKCVLRRSILLSLEHFCAIHRRFLLALNGITEGWCIGYDSKKILRKRQKKNCLICFLYCCERNPWRWSHKLTIVSVLRLIHFISCWSFALLYKYIFKTSCREERKLNKKQKWISRRIVIIFNFYTVLVYSSGLSFGSNKTLKK